MPWAFLVLAGLFEVVWAVSLKYTQGFTKIVPSAITLLGIVASIWLLALAMRALPLGTAYAVWVGIGTIGAFTADVILFGERANWPRVISIVFIIIGLVGLKLSTPTTA
jgi:quaternary ammonium compound-resistance protein SugE